VLRWIAIAGVVAVAGRAVADPELGRSTRGGSRYTRSADLRVIPIYGRNHRGITPLVGWQAIYDGAEIDHARFYRLVGRDDLASSYALHRDLGIAAIIAGVLAAGIGFGLAVDRSHRTLGLGMLGGGLAVSFAGVAGWATRDGAEPADAQELADYYNGHKYELSVGGAF
jgi:hypothetical protein